MEDFVDPAAFVDRAEAYAKRAGIELTTLGQKIFKDRRAFDRVRAGRVTYRSLQKAQLELEILERASEQAA